MLEWNDIIYCKTSRALDTSKTVSESSNPACVERVSPSLPVLGRVCDGVSLESTCCSSTPTASHSSRRAACRHRRRLTRVDVLLVDTDGVSLESTCCSSTPTASRSSGRAARRHRRLDELDPQPQRHFRAQQEWTHCRTRPRTALAPLSTGLHAPTSASRTQDNDVQSAETDASRCAGPTLAVPADCQRGRRRQRLDAKTQWAEMLMPGRRQRRYSHGGAPQR
jgi:hypothetical protein